MRSTGVTFRQTLRALIKASEGKYVFFVGRTQSHVDVARGMAGMAMSNILVGRQLRSRITFPNGGFLRFMTLDSFDRPEVTAGIDDPQIIYDL